VRIFYVFYLYIKPLTHLTQGNTFKASQTPNGPPQIPLNKLVKLANGDQQGEAMRAKVTVLFYEFGAHVVATNRTFKYLTFRQNRLLIFTYHNGF
jgi:hypothetical protein